MFTADGTLPLPLLEVQSKAKELVRTARTAAASSSSAAAKTASRFAGQLKARASAAARTGLELTRNSIASVGEETHERLEDGTGSQAPIARDDDLETALLLSLQEAERSRLETAECMQGDPASHGSAPAATAQDLAARDDDLEAALLLSLQEASRDDDLEATLLLSLREAEECGLQTEKSTGEPSTTLAASEETPEQASQGSSGRVAVGNPSMSSPLPSSAAADATNGRQAQVQAQGHTPQQEQVQSQGQEDQHDQLQASPNSRTRISVPVQAPASSAAAAPSASTAAATNPTSTLAPATVSATGTTTPFVPATSPTPALAPATPPAGAAPNAGHASERSAPPSSAPIDDQPAVSSVPPVKGGTGSHWLGQLLGSAPASMSLASACAAGSCAGGATDGMAVPVESPDVLAPPAALPCVADDKATHEPVLLHIYDVDGALETVNDLMKPVGAGAFHAGVEVYGKEWSYGYSDNGSGVYWDVPRCNSRHRYRESMHMCGTRLSEEEVTELLAQMKLEWPGSAYDLLVRNCCHFSDAFSRRLDAGPIPEWLMNLAGAGAALANGMEQAVERTHEAVGLAAAKACELDEHYRLTERAERFSTQPVTVDEEYLGAQARDLWASAWNRLAPVGALAESLADQAMRPISEEQIQLVESRARELWASAFSEAPQTAAARGESEPAPKAQD